MRQVNIMYGYVQVFKRQSQSQYSEIAKCIVARPHMFWLHIKTRIVFTVGHNNYISFKE